MPQSTSTTQQPPSPTNTPWPDGVVIRYLTIVGATIDLRRPSHDAGSLHGECGGCSSYFSPNTDFIIRDKAQAHAEKCRALPRPAVTA